MHSPGRWEPEPKTGKINLRILPAKANKPMTMKRTLLGAPGLTTSKKLLGAPGIATRSKDATRSMKLLSFFLSFFLSLSLSLFLHLGQTFPRLKATD